MPSGQEFMNGSYPSTLYQPKTKNVANYYAQPSNPYSSFGYGSVPFEGSVDTPILPVGDYSGFNQSAINNASKAVSAVPASAIPAAESAFNPYIAGAGVLAGIAAPLLAKEGRGGQTASGMLSGAATGASIGSMFGPGPGTLIGAGVGALAGGLAGLFSKSPEEERQARMDEIRKKYDAYKVQLNQRRAEALKTGTEAIGKQTSGLVSRFSSGAAKRAMAMGRTGDVESFQLPVAEKVASAGSDAMGNYQLQTNQAYDSALNQADAAQLAGEENFAMNTPIQPNAVDYLSSIAPQAVQFAQNQSYADMLAKYRKNESLNP